MGYILSRDAWGHGYGTEAARRLVRFGFEIMKAHKIIATSAPENHASVRVLEKAGMTREGYLKEDVLVDGRWRDSILMAVLDHEWRIGP